jgi:pyrroline-5-carboxylate reductase
MKKKIGLIGTGHLAKYLVTGLLKADADLEFSLADPNEENSKGFADKMKCFFTTDNQEAVDRSEVIILATRPEHVEPAIKNIVFDPEQLIVSVAAGVSLSILTPLVSPARAIRALPISCVSINKSPVLIFPEEQRARDIFSLVGQVYLMPDEKSFSPGTALVGAFYAWMFLLMDETTVWTAGQGIDKDISKKLVIETIEGACAMARDQDDISLSDIWQTLATPGGISEQGAGIISKEGGLSAWSNALTAVNNRLKG